MTPAPPGRPAGARRARSTLATAVALAAPALIQHGWAEGRVTRVAMKDVAFVPAEATAKVGGTIAWHNADIVAHTATSKEGGFDVEVPPEGTAEAVMTRPGTFIYVCRFHPNMRGRIVVEP